MKKRRGRKLQSINSTRVFLCVHLEWVYTMTVGNWRLWKGLKNSTTGTDYNELTRTKQWPSIREGQCKPVDNRSDAVCRDIGIDSC